MSTAIADVIAAVKGSNEAFDDFQKNTLGRVDTLQERIEDLESKRLTPGRPGSPTTIGDRAAQAFVADHELLEKTRTLRIEVKAAADPLTTSEGRTVLWGGLAVPSGGVIGIQTALPMRNVPAGTTVEYSRYTSQQGAAAQQTTEGSAKAALKPDFTLVAQSALTIAGYTKLSRQAMQDVAELRQAVNTTIRRSLDTAMDVAITNGATGFAGGLEALATAFTSATYTSMADAISEGVSTMQIAGFNPNLVALNPASWLAAVVAKGTANDHYLSGNYLGALPQEMRGLRVVLSPSVDAGKALLIDTAHVELVTIGSMFFEAAYAADDFTKNLITVLGELRFAPVFRAVGAARFITPKA